MQVFKACNFTKKSNRAFGKAFLLENVVLHNLSLFIKKEKSYYVKIYQSIYQ